MTPRARSVTVLHQGYVPVTYDTVGRPATGAGGPAMPPGRVPMHAVGVGRP